MAKLDTNIFSSYTFESEKEEQDANIIQGSLGIKLQNMLAMYAIDRANLKFSPESVNYFRQQEAYLLGKIELLQCIINESNQELDNRNASR